MAGRKSKRGRYARSAAPRNTAINIRSTSNAVDEAQVSKQSVTGTSNQKHSNLRPRQNPTNATPQNTTITVPSTSTAVDEAQVPTERPAGTTNQEGLNLRRGRSRSKKPVQESKTSLAPSPKRVGSRVGDPSKVFEDLLMIRKGDAGHAAEVAQAAARAVKVVPPLDAVVKVFSARAEPNFLLPWQTKQTSVITSGFIIKERKVLTQAYYVENHTRVMIKKRGSDTKYLASVLAVGSECDIAILTVSDDEFWEGVSPVEFGDLPALETPVTVVGYPEGGHTISVCNAVVSRGDFLPVGWSTELFVLQIDAPIESGFAGAPAFSDDGKCVGIAIESYKVTHGEKIGYLVSAPIITHFIQDFDKNGAYTGFPELGIDWQDMENPDLRKLMGMEPNQTGVRIRRVEPTAPESQVLKPSDVILSFDGVNIANDGSVPTRPGVHMHFSYLVSQKYIGDNAVVKILRNSDTLEFNIKLGTRKRLIPDHFRGNSLPYYIIAGFVFMVVSGRYLRSQYGNRFEFESPVRLLDKLLETMAESEDEQIVVVSQVLLADINIGYEGIVNKQVIAFNGKRVKNLKHLAGMVESCNEEFLKFVLEYNQIVVLQTKRAKEATADILRRHTIPSAMSDDLKTSDEIGEGSKKT